MRTKQERTDPVNHPAHYNAGSVEVIDIIDQTVANYKPVPAYYVGQVIKYLSRAPLKGSYEEDLKKAHWYLSRLIEKH